LEEVGEASVQVADGRTITGRICVIEVEVEGRRGGTRAITFEGGRPPN